MNNYLKRSNFVRYLFWMKPMRSLRDTSMPIFFKGIFSLPLIFYGTIKYVSFFKHITEKKKYKYNYAIVAIVKNEAPYIEEWINYHKKIGVEKFYIYNNDSTDNLIEVLRKYISEGSVDLINYPGKKRQCFAYNDAVEKHRYDCKYIAAIDLDEFILPLKTGNMSDFDKVLSKKYNYGGLGIHWCCFGSSGHIHKPEGGVLENYTNRAEDSFKNHIAVKTVFNPRKVIAISNPHFPCYRPGIYNINENEHKFWGPVDQEVSYSKFRLNHYFCKSKDECIAKFNRGMADVDGKRSWDKFVEYDRNEVHDTTILKLLHKIDDKNDSK